MPSFFFLLKQGLPMYPRLASSSICSPGCVSCLSIGIIIVPPSLSKQFPCSLSLCLSCSFSSFLVYSFWDLFLYVWVFLLACMFVHDLCAQARCTAETRRGRQISSNWSYRWWFLVAIWVLGTQPGSSGRAVGALSCWAIFSPSSVLTLTQIFPW